MIGTLNLYIFRRFLAGLATAVFSAIILVITADLVELAQRNGIDDGPKPPMFQMALLHMPSILSGVLPFVVLLGSLGVFLRLSGSSELVILRASGQSVWRVLTVPILTALTLGVLGFSIWNPISAAALARYENLETEFFEGRDSLLSISSEGLWLRQTSASGQTVINARRASSDGTVLANVTMFTFDQNGTLVGRIVSSEAVLEDGFWAITDAYVWRLINTDQGQDALHFDGPRDVVLPTDLTSGRILESFSSPESLSFWQLTGFISTLEASGFSSVRHRLYQQTELARPLMFAAMVLIAAGFSMRHARFGSTGTRVLLCVMSGFLIFFLTDFTKSLGSAGTIPVYVAAWVPPLTAMLLAISLLLHLEDG